MARRENKKENKDLLLRNFVIFLAILVVALPAVAFGYIYFKLNGIVDNNADYTILDSTDYKAEEGITNILLVGTDGRPGDKSSRSDAMIIATLDNKNKSLKLTSLNRDTYVDIPDHGKEKLTHAYVYGGINLLTETIENNFQIDIQNYAIVDFLSFMDIIDALGGVEVEVKQNEISEVNKFIKSETYEWSKSKDPIKLIEKPGIQRLNGYQALSFSRIRKNDSTMERDRRQRALIEGVMQGVKDLPVSGYPNLIDTILPHVKTNMRPTKIINLGTKALGILGNGINQIEFPLVGPDHQSSENIPGAGYVIKFTPESLDILHDFIFNNIIP